MRPKDCALTLRASLTASGVEDTMALASQMAEAGVRILAADLNGVLSAALEQPDPAVIKNLFGAMQSMGIVIDASIVAVIGANIASTPTDLTPSSSNDLSWLLDDSDSAIRVWLRAPSRGGDTCDELTATSTRLFDQFKPLTLESTITNASWLREPDRRIRAFEVYCVARNTGLLSSELVRATVHSLTQHGRVGLACVVMADAIHASTKDVPLWSAVASHKIFLACRKDGISEGAMRMYQLLREADSIDHLAGGMDEVAYEVLFQAVRDTALSVKQQDAQTTTSAAKSAAAELIRTWNHLCEHDLPVTPPMVDSISQTLLLNGHATAATVLMRGIVLQGQGRPEAEAPSALRWPRHATVPDTLVAQFLKQLAMRGRWREYKHLCTALEEARPLPSKEAVRHTPRSGRQAPPVSQSAPHWLTVLAESLAFRPRQHQRGAHTTAVSGSLAGWLDQSTVRAGPVEVLKFRTALYVALGVIGGRGAVAAPHVLDSRSVDAILACLLSRRDWMGSLLLLQPVLPALSSDIDAVGALMQSDPDSVPGASAATPHLEPLPASAFALVYAAEVNQPIVDYLRKAACVVGLLAFGQDMRGVHMHRLDARTRSVLGRGMRHLLPGAAQFLEYLAKSSSPRSVRAALLGTADRASPQPGQAAGSRMSAAVVGVRAALQALVAWGDTDVVVDWVGDVSRTMARAGIVGPVGELVDPIIQAVGGRVVAEMEAGHKPGSGWTHALGLLRHMCSLGVIPAVESFESTVTALCAADVDVEHVVASLQLAEQAGLTLSPESYESAVTYAIERERPDDALTIMSLVPHKPRPLS